MKILLTLLLWVGTPKDAASLGTYATSLDLFAGQVMGFSGEADVTLSVWPSPLSRGAVLRKIKNQSQADQAQNLYLLTLCSNAVQNSLTKALSNEGKTPEEVRRMMGLLARNLDRVSKDGQGLAVASHKSRMSLIALRLSS